MTTFLDLPSDARTALSLLRSTSGAHPVVVFKRSPTCPISHRAEMEFKTFLSEVGDGELAVGIIDVIAERDLARGLTADLNIEHESPQALWFNDGELVWHASHSQLTRAAFAEQLANS